MELIERKGMRGSGLRKDSGEGVWTGRKERKMGRHEQGEEREERGETDSYERI